MKNRKYQTKSEIANGIIRIDGAIATMKAKIKELIPMVKTIDENSQNRASAAKEIREANKIYGTNDTDTIESLVKSYRKDFLIALCSALDNKLTRLYQIEKNVNHEIVSYYRCETLVEAQQKIENKCNNEKKETQDENHDRVNNDIAGDIVKTAWMINNVIEEIYKLQREIIGKNIVSDEVLKVEGIYNNQLKLIRCKNYDKVHIDSVKSHNRPVLTEMIENYKLDLDNVVEYRDELVNAINIKEVDEVKPASAPAPDDTRILFKLYNADTKTFIEKGYFKKLYDALNGVDNIMLTLQPGNYVVIGDSVIAKFRYHNKKVKDVVIQSLKNMYHIQCEMLIDGEWTQIIVKTNEYELNNKLDVLHQEDNIRVIKKIIPVE